ncbi:MAG: hypothetical protein RL398_3383 [Planctomycetota bacterium]
MAGGSGTRFWPASRTARPKQFLPLANGQTLIAATVERLRGACSPERIWIVTNATQAAQLPHLLPGFPMAQVIVEPEARDTAPCVALATATIAARDPQATIAMMPADHVIEPAEAFVALLRRGAELAADGATLVTFGIRPTFAATGYGYIECGERRDEATPPAFAVSRFREKPDVATATEFLRTGRFLWNSGIFVWRVDAIAAAMMIGDAGLGTAYAAMVQAARAGDAAALAAAFRAAPRKSVDYAVMERAPKIAVVAAEIGWNDVGSFPALAEITPADAGGNHALLGDGATTVLEAANNNLIYAEGKRAVALFGVHDLVVVAVGDAVLVCPRDRAADLKVLVDKLRAEGLTDLL